MQVEIDPKTLLQLKQICESKKFLSFVDLLKVANDFIEECDDVRDDINAAKSLFFKTIVDICDGEDDKFGTEDDVAFIEDKLDTIRKVSDAVVEMAFKVKEVDQPWKKIGRFFKR